MGEPGGCWWQGVLGGAAAGTLSAVAGPALRGLSRFARERGIPASPQFLLDYDVIEAFCVAGLAGRADSTRGAYRSALCRLAVPVHGGPGMRATPFAGAKAPPPYSQAERAELAAIAAAQRGPAKRASALALVVFGIGAGLRPGELLPAERDIAAEYGVAYDTVRRATALLRERELIVTVVGRGTFVAEQQN